MPPRKRLGQLLTELGVIDEHQLQSALGHQKQWGGKLGGILVQKGFCSEDAVVAALTKHLGIPRVKLAQVKIDPRAASAARAGAASARAAPYTPPPIPAAKPPAGQKLEEIEPDPAVVPRAPPPPASAEPVDLPEVDEGDFGLEPIAAHSQFGDAVAGQEEVAGDGAAADAVEGLVSASVAHAGAAMAREARDSRQPLGPAAGHARRG